MSKALTDVQKTHVQVLVGSQCFVSCNNSNIRTSSQIVRLESLSLLSLKSYGNAKQVKSNSVEKGINPLNTEVIYSCQFINVEVVPLSALSTRTVEVTSVLTSLRLHQRLDLCR